MHTDKGKGPSRDAEQNTASTRTTRKTIIITRVSTFIRHRSAQQSFPLAAWLPEWSTCWLNSSHGRVKGWVGGGVERSLVPPG